MPTLCQSEINMPVLSEVFTVGGRWSRHRKAAEAESECNKFKLHDSGSCNRTSVVSKESMLDEVLLWGGRSFSLNAPSSLSTCSFPQEYKRGLDILASY